MPAPHPGGKCEVVKVGDTYTVRVDGWVEKYWVVGEDGTSAECAAFAHLYCRWRELYFREWLP